MGVKGMMGLRRGGGDMEEEFCVRRLMGVRREMGCGRDMDGGVG